MCKYLFPIYLIFLVAINFIFPNSFIKDVFIFPAFFILPFSIGFLIIQIVNKFKPLNLLEDLSKTEQFVSFFFLGLITTTLFYKNIYYFNIYYFLALAIISGIIFPFSINLKIKLSSFIIPALFAVFSYYFYILCFSSYPYTDIFQQAHLYKGALEFSRFHFINPNETNSYLQVIQAHLGILNYLYNIQMINMPWIAPVYTFLFCFVILHIFFKQVLDDKIPVLIASTLVPILLKFPFYLVNETLSLCSSLFFLNLINKENIRQKSKVISVSFACSAFVFLFIKAYFSNSSYSSLFLFVISGILFYFLRYLKIKNAFIICIILISSSLLHRASVFFISAFALYFIYRGLFDDERISLFIKTKIKFILYTLYISIFISGVVAFLFYFKILQVRESIGFFIQDISFFLMKHRNYNYNFESQYITSYVEWIRLANPLFIFIGLFLIIRTPLKLLEKRNIIYITLSCILFLFTLTGLPYIYRGQIIALLFLIMTISLFAKDFEKIKTLPLFLFYLLTVLLLHIYGFRFDSSLIENVYLKLNYPLILILLAVTLVVIFLPRIPLKQFLVLAILIWIDRTSIILKFYGYSYGPVENFKGTISHYSEIELKISNYIYNLNRPVLILSDPATVSIVKGLTGVSGFYPLENIMDISAPLEYSLKKAFNSSNMLDSFSNYYSNYYSTFDFYKYFYKNMDASLVMNNTFIIVTSKLFEWLRCESSKSIECNYNYFLKSQPLNSNQIIWIRQHFEVISTDNNHFFIVKIKRP